MPAHAAVRTVPRIQPTPHPDRWTPGLIRRALERDAELCAQLIEYLTPIIRQRVTRALRARGASGSGMVGGCDLDDATQHVFEYLFASNGRALCTWDPDRGSGLKGFVVMVADRQVCSLLRRKHCRPGVEMAAHETIANTQSPCPDPDRAADARDRLDKLMRGLKSALTERGFHVCVEMFVQERSTQELQASLGMSRDALYAWRSRIRRTAVEVADQC